FLYAYSGTCNGICACICIDGCCFESRSRCRAKALQKTSERERAPHLERDDVDSVARSSGSPARLNFLNVKTLFQSPQLFFNGEVSACSTQEVN
ncbi:hypothetical protein TGDOM2_400690, partial [Toxoplasma gondii GAB2-2007-GAL-DOM2]